MNSPALTRGARKGIRTLIQTIAGGGLTALVTILAGGLSPSMSALLLAIFTALVSLAQNYLETRGAIPAILPTAGLITTTTGGALGTVVGTVDAVAETGGYVAGDVVNTAGNVVGGITGVVDGVVGAVTDVLPGEVLKDHQTGTCCHTHDDEPKNEPKKAG